MGNKFFKTCKLLKLIEVLLNLISLESLCLRTFPYFFSEINRLVTDCESESIILNSNAVQNESTTKPPTILEQSKMIKALMTNRNNPKVTRVTGNVKNIKIGFTKILSNPKTTATIIEVTKLETVIPDMK